MLIKILFTTEKESQISKSFIHINWWEIRSLFELYLDMPPFFMDFTSFGAMVDFNVCKELVYIFYAAVMYLAGMLVW